MTIDMNPTFSEPARCGGCGLILFSFEESESLCQTCARELGIDRLCDARMMRDGLDMNSVRDMFGSLSNSIPVRGADLNVETLERALSQWRARMFSDRMFCAEHGIEFIGFCPYCCRCPNCHPDGAA